MLTCIQDFGFLIGSNTYIAYITKSFYHNREKATPQKTQYGGRETWYDNNGTMNYVDMSCWALLRLMIMITKISVITIINKYYNNHNTNKKRQSSKTLTTITKNNNQEDDNMIINTAKY